MGLFQEVVKGYLAFLLTMLFLPGQIRGSVYISFSEGLCIDAKLIAVVLNELES